MARLVTLTESQRDYFWSRVERGAADACWPWRGTILNNGYGQAKFSRKRYLAHRLALALSGVEVPDDMRVLHAPLVCHNRACCNPAHLRVGTDTDNARDRVIDGTASHLRPGKHAPNGRLGMSGAALARFLVSLGNTQTVVAEWLRISRPVVSLVVSGRIWS